MKSVEMIEKKAAFSRLVSLLGFCCAFIHPDSAFDAIRSVIYRIAIFTTRVIWQRIHVYVAITADNLLSVWPHLPLYSLLDTGRLRSDDPGLSDRRFTRWYQKMSFRLE